MMMCNYTGMLEQIAKRIQSEWPHVRTYLDVDGMIDLDDNGKPSLVTDHGWLLVIEDDEETMIRLEESLEGEISDAEDGTWLGTTVEEVWIEMNDMGYFDLL